MAIKKNIKKKPVNKNPTAKKIYNKFKRDFKNSKEFIETRETLDNTLGEIISLSERLGALSDECEKIKRKKYKDPESVLDSLPIESLKDLYGTEDKFKFKDIVNSQKLEKEFSKIIEEQDNLSSKSRLLHIELIEKRINALLESE